MSKHLLECLDQYTRSQTHNAASARTLHYNALELKALVQEIRDSSDEKSGLQEFYETLERIVNELRGMTEHSTAFLQRVRKSDAPNYFEIIKNPMDLGLLLKKVKMREYRDKKSFSDDLNLIWDNCFEYNTWVDHPLRRSASILRTKGNQLLQFVNDVPQKPTAPAVSGFSRAGSFRAGSTVAASEADAEGDADTDLDDGEGGTPAARISQKNRLIKQRSRAGTEQLPDTPDRAGTPATAAEDDVKRETSMLQEDASFSLHDNAPNQGRATSIAEAAAQSLTASAKRQLENSNATPFEDWPALERTTQNMSEFLKIQSAFYESQPIALPFASSSSVTLESVPSEKGEGERTVTPAQQESEGLPELVTLDEEGFFKQMRRPELFRSAIPEIPFLPASSAHFGALDTSEPLIKAEPLSDSLASKVFSNVQLISQVRKLNTATLRAHPKFKKSSALTNGDPSDDDPPSELESDLSKESCFSHAHASLYKTNAAQAAEQRDLTGALSLLLSHSGFDGAHRRAIDALSDLIKQYIFNLGRTAKFFSESHGARMTLAEILGQTLAENGIPRPESLSQHIKDVESKSQSLNRMREQLQDIHDTLQSDSIDAEGLPDYLTSPAAFMEDADSESRQPTVESTPFATPEPFVSLRNSSNSDDSASEESITAQIGLLQPYMRQRVDTEWGLSDDAEAPARMKKGLARPKVPASGKIPTKRRATAMNNATSSNVKKQKVSAA